MLDLTPPCNFPLRNFTHADMVFGARADQYLSRTQLGDWYRMDYNTPFHKAVNTFFHKGGKLSDFGLTVKQGIDPVQVHKNIRALMNSFAPKHEIKIGTVAVALANWCDYTP